MRARFERGVLDSLNSVLAEPIESLLMSDGDGNPCLETKTTRDLEHALRLPAGSIFHGDLSWPWAEDGADLSTPARRWASTRASTASSSTARARSAAARSPRSAATTRRWPSSRAASAVPRRQGPDARRSLPVDERVDGERDPERAGHAEHDGAPHDEGVGVAALRVMARDARSRRADQQPEDRDDPGRDRSPTAHREAETAKAHRG